MNKNINMILKFLKYIGILLLIGFVYLVISFYNNPIDPTKKNSPFIDRVKEAIASALFVGIATVIMVPYELSGNTVGNTNRS